jgi:hypothetical protein
MTLASAAAAALLFGLIHGPYRPTETKVYAQSGWLLTVDTDTFNHAKTCQLETQAWGRPGVTVGRQALAFHFDPRIDTYDAWYAINGGPPKAWRDQGAKLIHVGAMATAEKLDNATGGAVVVPMDDLVGAHSVAVRPTLKHRPYVFDLTTLWPVLASAEALGCQFKNHDAVLTKP